MKLLPALAFALLALSSPASAAPVTLDACGQTVVDAVLGADLDCTATPGFAVIIAPDGRLDLAGQLTNFGVEAYRKLYAEDSSIEGNCVAPYSSPCTDIVTYGYSMPLLVNTTCSTSLRYRPGSYVTGTWGICSND